jgi:cold shock CspA family protein
VVKWFSPEKGFGFVELSDGSGDAFLHGAVLAQNRFGIVQGYGFITRVSGDGDIFVHVSALERSGLTDLTEGGRVIAGVVEGRKGPEAARVRLA